jgi:RsiW-degrading membrane proteinase PrsW (M82 family)
MIVLYCIIAVYIGWIWIDYFRQIGVFKRRDTLYIIFTFLGGAGSALFVIEMNKYVFDKSPYELSGKFFHDLFYCIFGIGLVEEFSKSIPFILIFLFNRKQFKEPLDYLTFFALSGLGFAALENILYFRNIGPTAIVTRAILSTTTHMFDCSIVAYGIILVKFKSSKLWYLIIPGFLLFAATSHGFYDFWLLFEGTRFIGGLVTIFYFFITITIFATILNNVLNNSSDFSYKRIIDSDKITNRMLIYYGVVFVFEFILLLYKHELYFAFSTLYGTVTVIGGIIVIAVVRLSRIRLMKGHWEKVKLRFPFKTYRDPLNFKDSKPSSRAGISGENIHESALNLYFEEFFYLYSLPRKDPLIDKGRIAFIEQKLFLKNDEAFYLAKIFFNEYKEEYDYYLIKPRTFNVTKTKEKYPIVALLNIDAIDDIEDVKLVAKDFQFIEWAYIKPI